MNSENSVEIQIPFDTRVSVGAVPADNLLDDVTDHMGNQKDRDGGSKNRLAIWFSMIPIGNAKVDGIGQMAGWSPHSTIEESRKILNSFIAGKLAMFSANNIGGKDSCRRQ